jgi:hypothetical protein
LAQNFTSTEPKRNEQNIKEVHISAKLRIKLKPLKSLIILFGLKMLGCPKHRNKPKKMFFGFAKQTEKQSKKIEFRFVSVRTETKNLIISQGILVTLLIFVIVMSLPLYLYSSDL